MLICAIEILNIIIIIVIIIIIINGVGKGQISTASLSDYVSKMMFLVLALRRHFPIRLRS